MIEFGKFVLKIFIVLLLGYYVLNDIEFSLFFDEVSSYPVTALLLVVFALLFSDLILAFRWKLISNDSFVASLEATFITGMMNIILPAKLGEVAKAAYLKNFYRKSLNRTISLIIFERFFDVLFLSTGALYVLLILMDNPAYQHIFVGIIVLQVLLLLMMKYYNKPVLLIASYLPFRLFRIYAKKILLTISRKTNGKVLVFTLATSLAIWIMNFLVTYAFLHYATSFALSPIQIFVVFIISGVGFALPLLPAGALTFQASYVFALGLYGISQSEALAASLVFHVVYIATMLIPGKLILLFKTRPKALHE